MIVTIVCDVLGEANNGTTIAAMNLINSLRAKGHAVRVVCPDKCREGEDGFYIVPTYNLGAFLNEYVAKNGVTLAKPDEQILKAAVLGADVVHVMMPFALGNAAAKLACRHGIPVTAGFHCQAENFTSHIFMMNMGLVNKITYSVFYKKLYKYCTAVHYPTQFICDLFENEAGPTNHYIISNGVSSKFVHKPEEKTDDETFRILFTGRLSKEKSHKVLIDAVGYSKYKDRLRLYFAGDGPQKQKIKEYCEKTLKHQPVFGFYSHEELVKLINSCDLYVHPAEIEIESIACLEAIACGLVPVISNSKRSATKYFALGENNLFECNDPRDLAKKIDYWIEHPDEKQKCREEYLGFSEKFTFESCMDKMEKMLSDAAKTRGKSR